MSAPGIKTRNRSHGPRSLPPSFARFDVPLYLVQRQDTGCSGHRPKGLFSKTPMKGKKQESLLLNLLQIGGTAVVYFIVLFFFFPDHPVTAGAISVCAIGEVMGARACWDLRHHPRFWLTLAAITVVQSAIIILVPWPQTRFPGVVLVPIGLADYAVVYGIIKFVERFLIRKS